MKSKTFPLFTITLLYFALAWVNISFALLALVCMGLPFLFLYRYKKKVWCQKYCPRADFFNLFKNKKWGWKAPSWLTGKRMRHIMLTYFCLVMSMVIFSTVMVALGNRPPAPQVKLFFRITLADPLPQLFPLASLPGPLVHLSYRFYSMMVTTTLMGTLMALLFKPRTWCAVCPVGTVSTLILNGSKDKVTKGVPVA